MFLLQVKIGEKILVFVDLETTGLGTFISVSKTVAHNCYTQLKLAHKPTKTFTIGLYCGRDFLCFLYLPKVAICSPLLCVFNIPNVCKKGTDHTAGYFSGFRTWGCEPTVGVPSPLLPPLSTLRLGPLNPTRGSGERCKLSS